MTPPLRVPPAFATSTVAREGEAGRRWIEGLPARVDRLCRRWDLRREGDPMHGYVGLVVPVVRRSQPLILKVSWMDASSAQEADALRIWDGRGAVQLLEADRGEGALLLERLDPDRSLMGLPVVEACRIAGGLLRRLAVPATPAIATLADQAAGLAADLPARWTAQGRPFPRSLLARVTGFLEAWEDGGEPAMVNTDLHFENVLAGRREPWLVVDPKVLAGDPAYGVAPLLWNRLDGSPGDAALDRRMAAVVEAAGLDGARAAAWSLVRVVDLWLWALEEGFTEDPERCRRLAEWLSGR